MSQYKMTREQILAIAQDNEFVVHRFRWSHEKLRKLTRKMLKEGQLAMIRRGPDRFVYTTPFNVRAEAAGREFTLTADPLCPEDF